MPQPQSRVSRVAKLARPSMAKIGLRPEAPATRAQTKLTQLRHALKAKRWILPAGSCISVTQLFFPTGLNPLKHLEITAGRLQKQVSRHLRLLTSLGIWLPASPPSACRTRFPGTVPRRNVASLPKRSNDSTKLLRAGALPKQP